jgi:hypothetical protein
VPAQTASGAAHQVGEIAALPKQLSIDHATFNLKSTIPVINPQSPMILLVHHGDAVGPDIDPMRPLSGPGRAASASLAAAAAARGD